METTAINHVQADGACSQDEALEMVSSDKMLGDLEGRFNKIYLICG